jgi:hypothetical protein
MHRILQARLTAEMSLLDKVSIDKANVLLPNLIKQINERFQYSEINHKSAFSPFSREWNLDYFLSIRKTRRIATGNIISINRIMYQPFHIQENKMINFKPHTPVLVLETLNNEILISVSNLLYRAIEFNRRNGNNCVSLSFPVPSSHP